MSIIFFLYFGQVYLPDIRYTLYTPNYLICDTHPIEGLTLIRLETYK